MLESNQFNVENANSSSASNETESKNNKSPPSAICREISNERTAADDDKDVENLSPLFRKLHVNDKRSSSSKVYEGYV